MSSWGSSAISVLVPASAAPGVVQVAVNTAGVSSNTTPFTVIPSVTGLSPSSAPVGGSVSIQGNNFGVSGSGTVTFNGLTAPVLGWSQTGITTQVPSGATSGNLVVTSNGTPSSGVAFSVVPGPSMTGVSASSGTAGTSVTISGSDFGVTQSSANGQVVVGGAVASITNWSNASISAQVPPNAPPGSGSIAVTLAGVPSNSYPFTVIPSLSAIGPNPGGAGGLVSISGADLGTSEGSVQFNGVSATVVDWSEQSVSAKVPALPVGTVPVTVTVAGITTNAIQFSVAPTIATLSPASGPVGTDVSITGSNFGSSGTVTFNGVNAGTTSWTDTVIVAQVPNAATSGPVLVSVSGVSTNPVPFTVSTTPGAITAISITPATFAMLIGDARTLQAVDSNGSPITGLSWSSSDTGIASFDAETGILTANAEGQATIMGTFQNFTAQATVNVYVADDNGYYPEGAVLWSGQAMAGYSAGQVIQATPTDSNLVDLFALDMDSQQANVSIRGLTADGLQKWTTQLPIPTLAPVFVPDRQGGLLITQQPVQPGYSPYSLLKVDNHTGKPSWIYSPLSDGSYGCDAWIPDKVSVHPDGTIYAVKLSHVCFSPSSYSVRATVVALDGATGLPKFSVDLPQSRDTEYYNGLLYQDSKASPYTSPISIMPDGSVYLEAESTVSRTDQFCTSSCVGTQSITDTVSLIKILSDGSSSTQVLNSYTCSANFPGSSCYPPNQFPAEVIPDGQGGVLATYSYCDYQYCPSQQPGGTLRLSHIDALGGKSDYTLPFAYASFWYGSMVLGDYTLFATDNTRIVAFDLGSGTTHWTWDAAQGHEAELVAATDGAGLVAKDRDTTGTYPWPETPIRFDASGARTPDTWPGTTAANLGATALTNVSYLASDAFLAAPGDPSTGIWPQTLTVASTRPVEFANSVEPARPPDGAANRTIKVQVFQLDPSQQAVQPITIDITERMNAAIDYWQKQGILLKWDGRVQVSPLCVVAPCLPSDYDYFVNVSGDRNFLYYQNPYFMTEFPDPKSVYYVFVNSVATDETNAGTLGVPDPARPPTPAGFKAFSNIVVAGRSVADRLPHETGHIFSLFHIFNPLNLMCGATSDEALFAFLQTVACNLGPSNRIQPWQVTDAKKGAAKYEQ